MRRWIKQRRIVGVHLNQYKKLGLRFVMWRFVRINNSIKLRIRPIIISSRSRPTLLFMLLLLITIWRSKINPIKLWVKRKIKILSPIEKIKARRWITIKIQGSTFIMLSPLLANGRFLASGLVAKLDEGDLGVFTWRNKRRQVLFVP